MASYLPDPAPRFPTATELFGPVLSAAVEFVQQLRPVFRNVNPAGLSDPFAPSARNCNSRRKVAPGSARLDFSEPYENARRAWLANPAELHWI
jgi:hypothetical protein